MTIIARSTNQMKSTSNRPVWYYSVVVLIALWMLLTVMELVDVTTGGYLFLLNYVLTFPLLIGAISMDRRRVRATGSNRNYIESSRLLNSWVQGCRLRRVAIRLSILILFYILQIPVVALALWYVAVVRRRAFRGANPQCERPNNKTTDTQTTPHEYVQARIEQGRERIERAENLFRGGNYYEAHKEFENTTEYFENVLALAIDYDEERMDVDLQAERTEVDDIIRVCQRNTNLARDALYNVGDETTELTSIEEFQAAKTVTVFFSYNSADQSIVTRIKDGIEARSDRTIDIYIYEEDPQPGADIPEKVKDRIREADLFLVLITPHSQDSTWVKHEVGFANGVDCEVVPILLETPETLKPGGLLQGKEYLTFAQDSPDDFFEAFMEYAADAWDIHTDNGTESSSH